MNQITLNAVVNEIAPQLIGQKFGRVFPLSRLNVAIDFRLSDGSYLFISLEPVAPRMYLIKRKLRDLEKHSGNPHSFVLVLRKRLANAVVQSVTKDENERVVRFKLQADDELDGLKNYTFIVQLTGRSANFFLLDANDFVIDCLRENEGHGQTTTTKFSPPVREGARAEGDQQLFDKQNFATFSEALDLFYQTREAEKLFESQAKSARAKIRQAIAKCEKLRKKMLEDLENHGDADKWKRLGDLLLANLADAARIDETVLVVDYFDDNTPTVEIAVDTNLSLTEAAEQFFKRYTKARNAKVELQKRLAVLAEELQNLAEQQVGLEQSITENDLSAYLPAEKKSTSKAHKEKQVDLFKGARRFMSSDGLEILVGKASKDNDYLTFRVAKSLDFWLHAADYGGSHVVVRNPNRATELPPKTLLESAQLAAFFSQAREQPKVAVNYTQKKFVNKPKGSVAGLVSLSAFKTILVEPTHGLERV